MLLLSSRFSGLPIGSIQSSHRVAQVHRLIINPQGLKIGALEVIDTAGNVRYLHTEDIAEMKPAGILIHHNEQLMEDDDLVRLQSLLEKDYQVVGKSVRTKAGKKLGTVSDFVVSSHGWQVQKIHVQPSMVKMFSQPDKIIDRQQIVTVSDKEIVVHDATINKKATAAKLNKQALLRRLKTEPATVQSSRQEN